MRHIHSIHPHGVVALAARSALRFAARRDAARGRDAWRPIALFWRQKRKGLESVRATRLALTAGDVRLAQFHLHFVIRENDRAARQSAHGLSPVAASHQTRVVMEHRRTIIQSRKYLVQARRAQFTVQVSPLRYAHSDSGTKLQTTAQYPNSTCQPIAPVTTTWRAIRPQSPNLGPTRLRVHLGNSVNGEDQTFQPVQTYKNEPPMFRSRSAAMRHSVPPRSHESTPAQVYFQPQKLVWRRAMQPAPENASNRRQWNLDVPEEQSHGRSFTGTEAASGMPHVSGHAPATPAIKIDPALMDRLTDDVIRKVERRARIERARQGL